MVVIMGHIPSRAQIRAALVGPPGPGVGACLERLHACLPDDKTGDPVSVDCEDGLLEWFDAHHLHVGLPREVDLTVYAAPGDPTRKAQKAVLDMAHDGVFLLVDARPGATEANREALTLLRELLAEKEGVDLERVLADASVVIVTHPEARGSAELREALGFDEAVPLVSVDLESGDGLLQAFELLTARIVEKLRDDIRCERFDAFGPRLVALSYGLKRPQGKGEKPTPPPSPPERPNPPAPSPEPPPPRGPESLTIVSALPQDPGLWARLRRWLGW